MRYRWLDTDHPVRCVGRNSTERGNVGRLLVLPRPGRIGNCLVAFGGRLMVCPANRCTDEILVNRIEFEYVKEET